MKRRTNLLAAAGLAAVFSLGITGAFGNVLADENVTENGEPASEAVTETAADDGSLQRVLDAGELKIGTEGTYAPFSYHNEEDKLVGYDVEVAEKIAEKLGVEAVFVETEWDSIIAGLDTGRFDIISNQVGITEERKEKFDFTIPDSYARGALIVKKGNTEISDFSDLEGKKAAHSLTSNWAQISESYGAELVGVDGFEQAVQLIISGRADFTINDNIAFYDYLKQKPDADVEIVKLLDEVSVSGIPVKKADQSLYQAVNQALQELSDEGVLKEISERYFGEDISSPEA